MEKTTIYLPRELERRLTQAARRAGRSRAALIREALERYLADEAAAVRPASLGAGSDEALCGRETEDWLRARWSERHGGC